MEIPEPKEKEKKVEELRRDDKKEKSTVEKLIDKIIFLIFRRPSNDPDVQIMIRGLADIALM